MTRTVLTMRGSSAARRPKRTRDRASGLTRSATAMRPCPGRWFLRSTTPDGRRRRRHLVRRGEADVVAVHAGLLGQVRARHVDQAFDGVVPGVGGLAQVRGHLLFAVFVGQVGGDEQGGDLHRHRRGEIAGFLLPAVQRRDRAVADQVAGRPAHHRPKELHAVVRQGLLAPGQVHQQDDERRLVELNAVPAGPAAHLHVLRPVSVGVLRDAEVEQHAPGVLVQPGGQQGGDRLDHVAGPDQVVAQVAVAVGEAPGSGQTGDDAALEMPWLRACASRPR